MAAKQGFRVNSIQLFKCLSDETRLLSTLLIFEVGELCVCELVEVLDESQSKVSRHLAQLRHCGILVDRRKEQWVYYSIHSELNAWAREILSITSRERSAELAVLIGRAKKLSCVAASC